MEIRKIVDYVNRAFIASDYLRAPDIYYYMDLVIDDINERLQTNYPNFTNWVDFVHEWAAYMDADKDDKTEYEYLPKALVYSGVKPTKVKSTDKYDVFPDEYIRTVLALGTAVKYYTRDEEGEAIAADYQNRYEMALFKMQRDYINQVPWYFQDHTGGYIDFTYVWEGPPRNLHPRGMVIHGYNGKNL